MDAKTTKYQLVELPVPATAAAGNRIYFQDQPQLRSQSGTAVFIESLEIFSNQAVTLSFLSGAAISTAAAIRNAMLVLNVFGYEDIQGVPLAALNRVIAEDGANFVPGVFDLFELNDLFSVDWTKSYVQLSAGTGAAYSYLFGVRYRTENGKIDSTGNLLTKR
jgi:hypothetical protein